MTFSDETKINKFNSYGRSEFWIIHVHQTMKYGVELVMIWGCMMTFGLGAWYKIEGRMDRHLSRGVH